MTTCTHTVDCGPLGEVDLTISYKYRPAHNGRGIEPDESASASIYWIKLGGVEGVDVDNFMSDDYITSEIIPACVANEQEEMACAAESHAEYQREMRKAA